CEDQARELRIRWRSLHRSLPLRPFTQCFRRDGDKTTPRCSGRSVVDTVKPARSSAGLVIEYAEFSPLDTTPKVLILQVASSSLWGQEEHRNDGDENQPASKGECTGESQCRNQMCDASQRPNTSG